MKNRLIIECIHELDEISVRVSADDVFISRTRVDIVSDEKKEILAEEFVRNYWSLRVGLAHLKCYYTLWSRYKKFEVGSESVNS